VALCDLDSRKGVKAMSELQIEYGADRAIFIKTDVSNTAQLEGNHLNALLTKILQILQTLHLFAKLFRADKDSC
jgi:hypothetical protein